VSTLVVCGKGDTAIAKVQAIALSREFFHRSSFKTKPAHWWQYMPRFEARFHNLTAQEISAIKVKLSFVHDIKKIELI
jgi:hypothetical protein